MILIADKLILREAFVAFHFVRECGSSPWVCIGFYMTHEAYADCLYAKQYSYMREVFRNEVKIAGPGVVGTYEFLHQWHCDHQNKNDVISKVVRYWTRATDFKQIMLKQAKKYIRNQTININAEIISMLMSRENYFPFVYEGYNNQCKIRQGAICHLKKIGLLQS